MVRTAHAARPADWCERTKPRFTSPGHMDDGSQEERSSMAVETQASGSGSPTLRACALSAERRPFVVRSSAPGVLDYLWLEPLRRAAPRPGEVEIRVQAAGLNFIV